MNLFKKISLAILLAGVATLTACSSEEGLTGDFTISEESITFTQLGEYKDVDCLVGDTEVNDVTITSNTDGIVDIVGTVIIAKANGTTTLEFTYEDETEYCVVKVSSSFSLSVDCESVINLKSEDTLTVNATVTYPNTYYTDLGVKYTSDNEEVATITDEGVITAVSKGVATITVTSVVEITTDSSTGMSSTEIKTAPASSTITIIVDNEFNNEDFSELTGVYSATYDFEGKDSSETELTWVRASVTLTLNEDGTFVQEVLNAKRANYDDGFQHVYNKAEQIAFEEDGKSFGYLSPSVMGAFKESGSIAILNGELFLVYKGNMYNLGVVEDNQWANTEYTLIVNMIPFHSDMNLVLEKQ